MPFDLLYTDEAILQLEKLEKQKSLQKQFKAVKKALRFLEQNPLHPGLNTHKYSSLVGPNGTDVFEAYAENKTPGAYRIFWCYFPPKTNSKAKGKITILAITPHP